ncbi:putative CBL-interacting protein kinase 5-like isoform 1 [Capsicum annuum]|nr:putative CBL-interacting protein kinase 5-like isoform 1 [Capsicum annuum]
MSDLFLLFPTDYSSAATDDPTVATCHRYFAIDALSMATDDSSIGQMGNLFNHLPLGYPFVMLFLFFSFFTSKVFLLFTDKGNGTAIAVKVFNLQLDAAFKSFDTECEFLHSLRHRNLIKVITSCSNLDFKALVLEYMPNGSLDKYLCSHNYFLNIRQRLSIMIDVACALEYLHHGCALPVIHCDVKPSNILLDEDMVSHLSDFGISKLLGEDDCDLYTKILATLGYIAPEYGWDSLVSTKCDVYSYGIMLLETFTRRKPNEFEGDLSLKQWVSYSLPEAVIDVVDANLVTSTGNRFQKEINLMASMMKVALDCCAESPAGRTNMKDVVGMLQKIKVQLLAC